VTARDPKFVAELTKLVAGSVKAETPLARFSTYRIGGPATVFQPAGADDAAIALRFLRQSGVPVFPLGLGSNVLLPDAGLDALVMRIGKGMDQIRNEGERWWIGAGLPAPLAARKTAEQGWSGIHMMVGVPGTVGGGVFMNAGCHGGQWADVVERVTVLDAQGEVRVVPRAAVPFTYRRSGLDGSIVTEVEVALTPGRPEELAALVQHLFTWRQEGTPFNQPCCGSVFKNPDPPQPEGWSRAWTAGSLIEASGLKGTTEGGAQISAMHANYFVNGGGATAANVIGLIQLARETVRRRFGVTLATEVKIIGPRGEYLDV
jgi:UDP-N-acetylmuramate dehydrogenase